MTAAMSPNLSGDTGFQSACAKILQPKEIKDKVDVQGKLIHDISRRVQKKLTWYNLSNIFLKYNDPL